MEATEPRIWRHKWPAPTRAGTQNALVIARSAVATDMWEVLAFLGFESWDPYVYWSTVRWDPLLNQWTASGGTYFRNLSRAARYWNERSGA